MAEGAPWRRREIVTRADGTTVRIAKPPRADLLWYPHHRLTTVLVRRTHDLDVAQRLAEQRWTEHSVDRALRRSTGRCLVVTAPPLARHRVGWWSTTASPRAVPRDAAQDQHGRVVEACGDRSGGASPGIEFRP